MEFDANRGRVKYCPCNKSNHDGKFAPFKGCEVHGYCHSCGKTFLPDLKKGEGFQFLLLLGVGNGERESARHLMFQGSFWMLVW